MGTTSAIPMTMESFVQWGGDGIGRENVAADKGIWSAGDFVPVVAAGNSSSYDGDGNASSDWVDVSTPTFGSENFPPSTAVQSQHKLTTTWGRIKSTSGL